MTSKGRFKVRERQRQVGLEPCHVWRKMWLRAAWHEFFMLLSVRLTDFTVGGTQLYCGTMQDVAMEMIRNQAAAQLGPVRPSHQLSLAFPPFPVRHRMYACPEDSMSFFSGSHMDPRSCWMRGSGRDLTRGASRLQTFFHLPDRGPPCSTMHFRS